MFFFRHDVKDAWLRFSIDLDCGFQIGAFIGRLTFLSCLPVYAGHSVCASLRCGAWPSWLCSLGSNTPLAIHQGGFPQQRMRDPRDYSHPRLRQFFTLMRFFVLRSTNYLSVHSFPNCPFSGLFQT